MNETLKTMWRRRSVRKYREAALPDEDLHLILEAARRAPTGSNRQAWRMVVVRDPDLRLKTAEACNGQMWMAQAQVILCQAVPADSGKVSGAIVLDHAVLAAASLGYGTCWIGAFDPIKLRSVLGISDDYDIICLATVGTPAETPPARSRKLSAELFCDGQYGSPLDYPPVELPDGADK